MAANTLNRYDLPGGGELTIAAMDEYSRLEIGRKTYNFVRRCMQNPELRAKIQARAAELRVQNGTAQPAP